MAKRIKSNDPYLSTELLEPRAEGEKVNLVLPPELQLFPERQVNVEVHETTIAKIYPLNVEEVLEFHISKPDSFIDPKSLLLHFQGQIVQVDDNGVEKLIPQAVLQDFSPEIGGDGKMKGGGVKLAGLTPSVISNLPSTMFKSIEVSLGNYRCPDFANNLASYRAYMKCLLEVPRRCMTDQMANSLYVLDYAVGEGEKGWESTLPNETSNAGLGIRYSMTGGKLFSVVSPLFIDILDFDQNQFLPPNLDLRLRLIKAEDSFFLMCNESNKKLRLKIRNAYLTCKFINLRPDSYRAFLTSISKRPILYPMKSWTMSYTIFKSGYKDHTLVIEDQNKLPRQVILAFASSKSFFGNFKTNPLYLHHWNLERVELDTGLQKSNVSISMDFTKKIYADAWHYFLNELQVDYSRSFLENIDYETWAGGRFIWTIDLSAGHDGMSGLSLPTKGTVKLNLSFKEPLAENIVCVFAKIENKTLSIDKDSVVNIA